MELTILALILSVVVGGFGVWANIDSRNRNRAVAERERKADITADVGQIAKLTEAVNSALNLAAELRNQIEHLTGEYEKMRVDNIDVNRQLAVHDAKIEVFWHNVALDMSSIMLGSQSKGHAP